MAKTKIPSKEEVEAKKEALKAKLNESKELAKSGRTSPTQIFLNDVKDLIEDAIKNGVTYTQISKDIYSIFNVKVHAQTIRAFAVTNLGVEKKVIKKSTSSATEKDKVLSEKNDDKKESTTGRKKASF